LRSRRAHDSDDSQEERSDGGDGSELSEDDQPAGHELLEGGAMDKGETSVGVGEECAAVVSQMKSFPLNLPVVLLH
jgi:hypothetical protein